ncbi:MAG: integrase core domain-containing protein [Rhodanobacter sp.]
MANPPKRETASPRLLNNAFGFRWKDGLVLGQLTAKQNSPITDKSCVFLARTIHAPTFLFACLPVIIRRLVVWLHFALAHFGWPRTAPPLQRYGHRIEPLPRPLHSRTKPAWVRKELIALAARAPSLGCRTLADIFNRRHAVDGTTVGKSFVSDLLRKRQADIQLQRRLLRRRIYRPGRPNLVWGMDGTGKTDESGKQHFLLGIVDHGTRRCLALDGLKDKASVTILRVLLDTIERHGKPRAIRTDNEIIFHSRLFRFALTWLGISHQTTELHCPWQNGRIERFFGTLKGKLDHWAVADRATLNASLSLFRHWYNHVRPHQHLQGLTPIEAWNPGDIRRRPLRRVWFEAWDGLLQGEYLQR